MRQHLSKLSNLVSSQPWFTKRNLLTVCSVAFIVACEIALIYNIQVGNFKTGFGSDETITTSEKRNAKGTVIETTTTKTQQDAKTVWDWLQLAGTLAIPIVIVYLTYQFQKRERARAEEQAKVERDRAEAQAEAERQRLEAQIKLEREIADTNRKEEALQDYFDRLSELLIDKNLIAIAIKLQKATKNQTQKNQPDQAIEQRELLNAAIDVIRARTLSILRRFESNEERRLDVINFLIEAEVISKLKLNLSGAELSFAELNNADLHSANLSGANLSLAELSGANLNNADLSSANLYCTNLSSAHLGDARNLTDEQLDAAMLCNTKLPIGSNLDPDRDCKELGLE